MNISQGSLDWKFVIANINIFTSSYAIFSVCCWNCYYSLVRPKLYHLEYFFISVLINKRAAKVHCFAHYKCTSSIAQMSQLFTTSVHFNMQRSKTFFPLFLSFFLFTRKRVLVISLSSLEKDKTSSGDRTHVLMIAL